MTDITPPKKESVIEVRDIISILFRRKWLIILPAILVTATAFGGSFLLEKRYQSATMIVIDQTKYLSKQLQALVPGEDNQRMTRAERNSRLIAIRNEIISSAYLSRLIDELELTQNTDVIGRAQKLHSGRPDIPVNQLVYYILIGDLRDNIDVGFNGINIIEITAESSEPAMAMDIASRLAEIYKDEQLRRDLSGVRGALDFSDEQLAIYKKNLEEADAKKAEFAAEYLRNQLDESVSADANIRTITADVDNIKLLIDDNIKEQSRVRGKLASYKKSQLVLKYGNDFKRLKETVFTETRRLADFMSKYTWSDPKVLNANLNINNRLRQLESTIVEEVGKQFSKATSEDRELLTEFFALRLREDVFRQKKSDFEVSLSTLRNRIARQPEYEIQMRNLENEVHSARDIYEKFKDQLTGSEISQSLMRGGAESKYRIMEPASVPLAPVKPNRKKIVVLGAILGFIIGGVVTILAELLDNSFKKVEEVEEFLGTRVLATIPNIPAMRKFKV